MLHVRPSVCMTVTVTCIGMYGRTTTGGGTTLGGREACMTVLLTFIGVGVVHDGLTMCSMSSPSLACRINDVQHVFLLPACRINDVQHVSLLL